jgi:hypothetical protein
VNDFFFQSGFENNAMEAVIKGSACWFFQAYPRAWEIAVLPSWEENLEMLFMTNEETVFARPRLGKRDGCALKQ